MILNLNNKFKSSDNNFVLCLLLLVIILISLIGIHSFVRDIENASIYKNVTQVYSLQKQVKLCFYFIGYSLNYLIPSLIFYFVFTRNKRKRGLIIFLILNLFAYVFIHNFYLYEIRMCFERDDLIVRSSYLKAAKYYTTIIVLLHFIFGIILLKKSFEKKLFSRLTNAIILAISSVFIVLIVSSFFSFAFSKLEDVTFLSIIVPSKIMPKTGIVFISSLFIWLFYNWIKKWVFIIYFVFAICFMLLVNYEIRVPVYDSVIFNVFWLDDNEKGYDITIIR